MICVSSGRPDGLIGVLVSLSKELDCETFTIIRVFILPRKRPDCETFAITCLFDSPRKGLIGFIGWPVIRARSRQHFGSPQGEATLQQSLFLQASRFPTVWLMDSAPKIRRPSHTGFGLHRIAFSILWSRSSKLFKCL